MSEPIHQEVVIQASPERVYEALTDAETFSALSGGAPAEITPEAGGAFSRFGGMISGRIIEAVPGRLLVEAWRVGNWPPGVYSIARFELQGEGSGTKIVFDHTGFPAEQREHLDAGWKANYWDGLKKHLE